MSGQIFFCLLLADVEEPGADRREEPLVEARAVVVAFEVVALERKVREGMRAVDEDLDAALARHPDDLADGQDLPGQVRDVRDLDDPGPRRDRPAEAVDDVGGAKGAARERRSA